MIYAENNTSIILPIINFSPILVIFILTHFIALRYSDDGNGKL